MLSFNFTEKLELKETLCSFCGLVGSAAFSEFTFLMKKIFIKEK